MSFLHPPSCSTFDDTEETSFVSLKGSWAAYGHKLGGSDQEGSADYRENSKEVQKRAAPSRLQRDTGPNRQCTFYFKQIGKSGTSETWRRQWAPSQFYCLCKSPSISSLEQLWVKHYIVWDLWQTNSAFGSIPLRVWPVPSSPKVIPLRVWPLWAFQHQLKCDQPAPTLGSFFDSIMFERPIPVPNLVLSHRQGVSVLWYYLLH